MDVVHPARLRAELIEAASTLLAERGDPERVSIRAVATRRRDSTVDLPAFPDRKSLLRAVVAERFGDFARRADQQTRDAWPAVETLLTATLSDLGLSG